MEKQLILDSEGVTQPDDPRGWTDFEQVKALRPPLSVLCGQGSVPSVTPAESLLFYRTTLGYLRGNAHDTAIRIF